MKIAIMQPYFMPYLGYFQLLNVVDKFIIYDDVTYIKQGWINRNKILSCNNSHFDYLFTIPLENSSSNKKINSILLHQRLYSIFVKKFLKTIANTYKNAPYFREINTMLESIFFSEIKTISALNLLSLKMICNYLSIKTELVASSTIYNNDHLKSQDRILDICRQENATIYYNLVGGMNLYQKEAFEKHQIKLIFLESNKIEYTQFDNEFVENLSIIDILMFNSKETIKTFLSNHKIYH